jgi:hypothetical protein
MGANTGRKVFEIACGVQLYGKLRCKHKVLGRQIEISLRHRLIVITVTESIFFNKYKNVSIILITQKKNSVVGASLYLPKVDSSFCKRTHMLQEQGSSLRQADSLVNCWSLQMLIHAS